MLNDIVLFNTIMLNVVRIKPHINVSLKCHWHVIWSSN